MAISSTSTRRRTTTARDIRLRPLERDRVVPHGRWEGEPRRQRRRSIDTLEPGVPASRRNAQRAGWKGGARASRRRRCRRAVSAHHYTIRDRYSPEVWYDHDGCLVRVKVIGPVGSVILYIPTNL